MLPKRRSGVPPAQKKSARGHDQRNETAANKSRSVGADTCGRRTNNPNMGKRTSLATNCDAPPAKKTRQKQNTPHAKKTRQKQANTDTSSQLSLMEGDITLTAEVVLQQFREMPTRHGAASNLSDAMDNNYDEAESTETDVSGKSAI